MSNIAVSCSEIAVGVILIPAALFVSNKVYRGTRSPNAIILLSFTFLYGLQNIARAVCLLTIKKNMKMLLKAEITLNTCYSLLPL